MHTVSNLNGSFYLSTDKPASLSVSSDVSAPNQGDTVTLTCAASSQPSITSYEWYKDGTQVSGETSTTLALTSIQSASAGSYTCKALIETVTSDASSAYVVTVLGNLFS